MGREEQQQVCNIPTWRRLCTWANKSGSRHHESPPRDVLIVSFAHGFDCIFGSTSFFLESSGPGDDFWDHPKPAWYLLCFQGFRGKIHFLSTLVFLQVLNMVTHEDHLNRLCGMSKVLLPTSSSVPFLSCNEKRNMCNDIRMLVLHWKLDTASLESCLTCAPKFCKNKQNKKLRMLSLAKKLSYEEWLEISLWSS